MSCETWQAESCCFEAGEPGGSGNVMGATRPMGRKEKVALLKKLVRALETGYD